VVIRQRWSCGVWVACFVVFLFELTLAVIDRPVQRLAGSLGLPLVVLVIVAAQVLERRALRVVMLCVWAVALLAALGATTASFYVSDASSGYVEDGVYYLTDRGGATEVSRPVYHAAITLHALVLGFWPIGFLLLFMMDGEDRGRPSKGEPRGRPHPPG